MPDSLNNKWKVYQPDSDKLAEMQVVPSSVKNPNNPDGGWGNQAWYGNDYLVRVPRSTMKATLPKLSAEPCSQTQMIWSPR